MGGVEDTAKYGPPKEFSYQHGHFTSLRIFYFRGGENELSVVNFQPYILPYVLRNATGLEELILAVRYGHCSKKSSNSCSRFVKLLLLVCSNPIS